MNATKSILEVLGQGWENDFNSLICIKVMNYINIEMLFE